MTPARWSVLFAVVGLAVSVYLSAVHYASSATPLACSSSGIVNCEQVTSSAESIIGSVPVAVLGVLWFTVYLALAFGGRRGLYRLAWVAAGLAFVFYLVYAELFLIGAVCLWCTVVHLVIVGLFLMELAQPTDELVEAT